MPMCAREISAFDPAPVLDVTIRGGRSIAAHHRQRSHDGDRALDQAGRIGPNAGIQLNRALTDAGETTLRDKIFAGAGCPDMIDTPPTDMIDEDLAIRLFHGLYCEAGPVRAGQIAVEAGRLTGRYILEHRIPGFARTALRFMPRHYAAHQLARAIVRHAWTFCGSSRVRLRQHHSWPWVEIVIPENRMALPGCPWHKAVFETLFQTLINPDTVVEHCQCCGHDCLGCVFRITVPE